MEFCNMGSAPKEVIELIEQFERNIESYKGQGYNEAGVRSEFINPFFEALGWDIANKGGTAEAYKDVIHEDAIKIGGTTKAPDYCFTHRRNKKILPGSEKTISRYKIRHQPCLSTSQIRMVGETAIVNSDRF